MATATFFLRRGKTGATIYVKYRHGEKDKLFNTRVRIDDVNAWNPSKNKIDSLKGSKTTKSNESLISELRKKDIADNVKISTVRTRILEISRQLELQGKAPTVEAVYSEYHKQNEAYQEITDEPGLIHQFDQFRQNNKSELAHNTWRQYIVTENHLMRFLAKKKNISVKDKDWAELDSRMQHKIDIHLADFRLKEMEEFRRYLKTNVQLSDASIKKNFDRIKRFLKIKNREGDYPTLEFKDIEIPRTDYSQRDIVYLTAEELRQLRGLKLPQFSRLDKVRDIFLMAASTGLRFGDVMRLKKERIRDDIIFINAQKTGKKLEIPFFLFAREILEKYDYQLPQISNQKINAYVKELMQKAGINQPIVMDVWQGKKTDGKVYEKWELISSHSGKKTFVMLNVEAGTPIEVLAEMTGNTLDSLKHYYRINTEKKKTHLTQVERAFMKAV